MNKAIKIGYLGLFFLWNVCFIESLAQSSTKALVKDLKDITDIMVYDVTSPVAAARYYAYITLVSYECLSAYQPTQYQSFLPLINEPLSIKLEVRPIFSNPSLAYRYALLYAANKILPSGSKLLPQVKKLELELKPIEIKYVHHIASTILDYSKTDGFLQLNNLKKYTPKRGAGYWQPTQPAFMAPIEPNWNSIRTFFLSKSDQFLTQPPVAFDMNPQSEFYRLTKEVKNVVEENNPVNNEIAAFWDCNPYAISQIGHLEFGLKKISPGGHWMGIAGIASIRSKMTIENALFSHTLLALSLHDAFVACWDEKYRSNRIRPETVINTYLDKRWTPILQTPPFPEYVSGHSVISTTSAEILTLLFGDNFKFRDNTEKEFGLRTRGYKSFRQAAEEACISRFYGGIHFMDAIDQGVWQGKKVANLIINKTQHLLN
ncbi:MAG: vanadium-dependent haloperoxidase [Flavobacteriaceae bacterium]